ncbi:MAG: MarR family winged helix-turn-helix transcriptional regulator [Tetrasphaera sp.]
MPHRSTALQLAQLGSLAASRWAARVQDLGLTPSEGLVLRIITSTGGLSQRELAQEMGIVPSRVVVVVDALEGKGMVRRVRSERDRRRYALELTTAGQTALDALARHGREHDAALTAPLSDVEREELGRLLAKLVEHHGMRPGIHPEVGRT